MSLWYPILNATNTLAGAFGSLNSAVSGNVLINGDWFWTMVSIAVFFVLIFVFTRNENDTIQSIFVSAMVMLVLTSILFSIGIIFIILPVMFFLIMLVAMSIAIASRPSYG